MSLTSKEESTFLIKHKSSSSAAQVRCGLNQEKKPKILSVKMISGNVIALDSVKLALKKVQEKYIPVAPTTGPS